MKPESHVLKQLLDFLVDLALQKGYQYRNLLADCVALLEWGQKTGYGDILADPSRDIKYARLYFELCKSEGVTFPVQFIETSKKYFRQHFEMHPNWKNAEDHIEYVRLLVLLGDYQTAAEIIDVVLVQFENDDRIANFLFYAGCIYKELQDFDRANNFFFESAQYGPPKFFSKIEIMIVISRLIEETGSEGDDGGLGGVTGGGAGEDAYRIVHQQLVLEGYLEEDVEYEDWVSDYRTWLVIADKCAMHEMFSLATEFYMMGISKDVDAYKRPNLWFRFAKSCFRCGRVEEAKLALRVSQLPSLLLASVI